MRHAEHDHDTTQSPHNFEIPRSGSGRHAAPSAPAHPLDTNTGSRAPLRYEQYIESVPGKKTIFSTDAKRRRRKVVITLLALVVIILIILGFWLISQQ